MEKVVMAKGNIMTIQLSIFTLWSFCSREKTSVLWQSAQFLHILDDVDMEAVLRLNTFNFYDVTFLPKSLISISWYTNLEKNSSLWTLTSKTKTTVNVSPLR